MDYITQYHNNQVMLTPQKSYPKLAKAIGVSKIILKREDLHPYGSHKGRSIPYMINKYIRQGYYNFVISSSGNAALAAAFTINKYNKNNQNKKITLQIFVGQNIEKKKIKTLTNIITDKNIIINQVERPKQSAFQSAKEAKTKRLKQSTDDSALKGYKTLAEELNIIKNLQAVFIPTSSGTTAEALGKFLPQGTQIHIVQTSACHPIAKAFNKSLPKFIWRSESVARAIVDNVAHRKEKVIKIIKNSRGFGWIANNDEIKSAIKLVKEKTNIEISPNSALSVAGLIKAVQNGWKFTGAITCLITGK